MTIRCTQAASRWARIRSRQTSTAAATSSTSSSHSEMTGLGVLTITSWPPIAGPDQNRSGLAWRGGGSESGLSAGYRFGTTRTVQPGPLGSPPPGRTA